LRERGVDALCIISGDAMPVVKRLSASLGFTEYKSGLLPEEKARYVEKMEDGGRATLMVGDGVNDALALSVATVGVAMGAGGSEVAVEAADVALATSDLRGLIFLRDLSGRTLRTVEQNFWIATSTNLAGIVLGATGWLSPFGTGLLHVAHSLAIMINSGRLLGWRPTRPFGLQTEPVREGDR
jgi:cation-transporting P-type ATPase C